MGYNINKQQHTHKTYAFNLALILSPLAALAGNGASTPEPATLMTAAPAAETEKEATVDIKSRRESTAAPLTPVVPSSSAGAVARRDAAAILLEDDDAAGVVNPSTTATDERAAHATNTVLIKRDVVVIIVSIRLD